MAHQFNPKKPSRSDSDVRITRKITINLKRKQDCSDNKRASRVLIRIIKNLVGIFSAVIRYYYLLKKTPQHVTYPVNSFIVIKEPSCIKLRKQFCFATNRPSY